MMRIVSVVAVMEYIVLPISRIRMHHAIKIAGRIAFVLELWPVSRCTEIMYKDGTRSKFKWDVLDPFVEDLGPAEMVIDILLI